jgi:hypothetical protein
MEYDLQIALKIKLVSFMKTLNVDFSSQDFLTGSSSAAKYL